MSVGGVRCLQRVLDALDVRPESLPGWGGAARVYALDDRRVLPVLHDGRPAALHPQPTAVVRELGSHEAPFLLPEALSVGEVSGRLYSIERRLPGCTSTSAIGSVSSSANSRYARPPGPTGHSTAPPPASAALPPLLQRIDPTTVTGDLPDAVGAAFVHLDAYTGNMLTANGAITAVLDFGATSVVGDTRFDPIASAV